MSFYNTRQRSMLKRTRSVRDASDDNNTKSITHWIKSILGRNRRFDHVDKVQGIMKSVDAANTICIFNPSSTIHSLLFDENGLTQTGKGSYGSVYVGKSIVGVKVAVKNCFSKSKVIDKDEWEIHSVLSDMVKEEKCAHFPFVYGMTICKECTCHGRTGTSYDLYMEAMDTTLYDYHESKGYITMSELNSFVFQLLVAVGYMHELGGIFHRDIKSMNVLMKRVSLQTTEYMIHGHKYRICNEGFLVTLADFGAAYNLRKPEPSFGSRRFMIDRTDTDIRHVELSYSPKPGTRRSVVDATLMSDRREIINKNVVRDNYVERSGIIVDVDDFCRFPAVDEFYSDIQDLVRMFVGGRRMEIPNGAHAPMRIVDDDDDTDDVLVGLKLELVEADVSPPHEDFFISRPQSTYCNRYFDICKFSAFDLIHRLYD